MNPLGMIVGPVFRAAMLATVLFYGANVGRAAGNRSLMQPAPWIGGAISAAVSGLEVGQRAASQVLAIPGEIAPFEANLQTILDAVTAHASLIVPT